jgi:tetratricopeptide (TPR) repeat protein
MKNILKFSWIIFAISLLFISCEDYVTDIDPLIDAVEDERLNDASQINFVLKGVKTQYSEVQDAISCLSGALSDEIIYSANLQGASFPSFQEIDVGVIELDNNSVDNVYDDLGELRLFADDLIRRVNDVNPSDTDLKNEALFVGNLYGAIARYFYAVYFGLNPDEGGGVIDNGPFIPSDDMFDLAVEKFQAAITFAADPQDLKVAHSLLGRTYLYMGDYANAATHVAQGLVEGDDPFQSLHTVIADNYWWGYAGAGRCQLGVDFRFKDYIDDDPAEANRIIIVPTPAIDTNTVAPYGTYYRQNMYPQQGSPINALTWQENYLMAAELELRGQATGLGAALDLVNAVRTSHEIADLAAVDLDVIFEERDKELFTTGARLIDQHRFVPWHLGAGTWKYLPITRSERANNPNID